MEHEVRRAQPDELDKVIEIIESGRAYLKAQGVPQWQNGTGPGPEEAKVDVARGYGYVLEVEGDAKGYATLIPGPEGSPELAEGAWNGSCEQYTTIHRVAIDASARGSGFAGAFIAGMVQIAGELGYPDIRIDTHPKNEIMQKVIARNGFIEVGVLELPFTDGKRLAYQLLLEEDTWQS
ncbi:MAG: GNAT family N-acetyltransferase [Oscillospiraceae bacterium]|nr:GNAT family N-acetyltransferase [Oscillospiraceae bacterium]